MCAWRSFTDERGCPRIFWDVALFGDAGQLGAQSGVLGLGFGQREGCGPGLIFVPLGLHPVAQGPVVEAQFLGGAGDVAAVALAVRHGRLLEGRVIMPAHAFGGVGGCSSR
jgi:hypothetical protein